MFTQKSACFLLVLFLLISNLYAWQPNSSNNFENVNKLMERLSEEGFSGAVLIAQNGKVSSNGYGFADREKKIKATPKTVFSTGSITKQFTGAAILKLEMQGKLSVMDKIGKYLENVPADKNEITIHHLLTHSSGLPAALGPDEEIIRKSDYLKRAFETPLRSKPDETYDYSNVGYSLLAAIIEKVSGENYEDFLHKNLFKPAKMADTGYSIPDWKEERVAVGYTENGIWGKMTGRYQKQPDLYWHLVGNGGISSTIEDLYKWHLALESDKILDKQAKEKFYKKHIREGENADSFYGYGWAIFPTPRNTTLIAHNGSNGVFFADFWRYPQEKTVIILLTNNYKREYENLAGEISETLRNSDYVSKLSSKIDAVYTDPAKHPDGQLIKAFFEAATGRNVEAIKNVVENYFEEGLKNSASTEKHLERMNGIGDELKGLEVDSIKVINPRSYISFKNSPLRLILVIENGKIRGIGITD